MPKTSAPFPPISRTGVALSATFAAVFFGFGVHLPFFPLWLADRGMGPAEVAILMATPLLQRAVTLPVTAYLADRMGDLRRAVMVFGLAAGVICIAFEFVRGFWALFVVTLMIGTVWGAIVPVMDALTMARTKTDGLDYGRIRLWGSISFVAASIIVGVVIDRWSIAVVVPIVAASLFVIAVMAATIPGSTRPSGEAPPRFVEGWSLLLATPGLVIIVLGAGFAHASHALLYVFGSIHWKGQGISESVIGMLWAWGVIAEIAFFIVSSAFVKRFGVHALIIAGCAIAVLRWSAMAFDPTLAGLFALQTLHAATFAALHVGCVNALANAVEERYAATAQGVYFTVLGLFNGLAYLLAGPVYGAYAGAGFAVMAALAAIGVALVLVGVARARRA